MVGFLLFLVSDTDITHGDESAGVTEKTLEEHNVVVALVVEVSESLPQGMGTDILLDPASLSRILQLLAQGVHFNVTTFTGSEDVLIRVVAGIVTVVPLNSVDTGFIQIESTSLVYLLLKD